MDNTIYSATTGMIARQKSMNITGNNIANLETNGYKRSQAVYDTFAEYLVYRKDGQSTEVGNSSRGVIINDIYTSFEQGPIANTGKALDFALDGFGFFTIESAAGGQYMLTRDGRFTVDAEGFLKNLYGDYVLGQNGRIFVGNNAVTVDEQGNIFIGGNVIDSFLITVPDAAEGMQMLSNGLIAYVGGTEAFAGRILQGCLEKSNVNLIDEMTTMLADARAFQACSQLIKAEDELNRKTVTELAKV
ncbi:MAG TPA: flagellar hook-basal body protein [Bacillota bacterium]|nr:flagellar hook-basal body protein [Bacillota bacterium]HOK68666.1 flagellar hook-basal body protein [Bacillota bacterium]HPP84778.1 flagellar hook-basal body protein [Bacillota bacterium]